MYSLSVEMKLMERELNAANDHIKLLKSTGDELLEWLKDGTISDSNYRLLANAWQRAKENKQ
jgi:molybdopterin biosynthesis enzyme